MQPPGTPGSARKADEPIGVASSAQLRSAHRLLTRKGREATGEFLAEGPQAVREALGARAVRRVFVTAEALAAHPELVPAGVPASLVEAPELAKLADTVTPQGIVAVCRLESADLRSVLAAGPQLLAICAQVRDPGNAGTVIRCADAFGAAGVVLDKGSVELANPKLIRGSVGSVFHLPIVTGRDLPEVLAEIRAAGIQVLAADGSGAGSLDELAERGVLRAPTAWLFGNEAWGLPADVLALADRVVRIPMWGRAESLNLATAAAVCLYTTRAAQRGTDA